MDYSKNLLYFTGTRNNVLIVIGFMVGFAGFGGVQSGGVVAFLIGGVMAYWGMTRKKWPVSDSDYDKSVKSYISNLKSIALDKLGVDESEVSEVPPIVLGGYEFEGVEKVKKGEDGRWRSNIYKFVAIFFSANELHCYTLRFNTLRSEMTEGTEVFFYEDIVSASTASSIYKVQVGEQEISVNPETFKITTRGGTSFTVNISDSQKVQESVNAMRALLREKKQA